MKILVEVYGVLREIMGWKKMTYKVEDGLTVASLLDLILEEYPKARDVILEGGAVKDYVKVLIDGRDFRFIEGLKTKLRDGSVVSIFPPAGGG
ncbi:MAG: molybdopterin synthase sulfur carrier subunit [Thermoprotei archaeon]|nr:MAG: molybdopterin synthase sulfur carrier subunit [Thermoprotei archaeon]RLF22090.1 MAG: molybdopterin synthase sulfur carrier subunit [Thermoprotei archaeon]